MGEIGYGAAFVEWFSAESRRAWGETISSPIPSKRMITIKQPIGVAGMITPVSLHEDLWCASCRRLIDSCRTQGSTKAKYLCLSKVVCGTGSSVVGGVPAAAALLGLLSRLNFPNR